MKVHRIFGRSKDSELVLQFSGWLVENLDVMNTDVDDEEAIQGTMTLDFQHPTSSFVVEVQTYDEKFAKAVVQQMHEMGFENSSIATKEGGIK